MRTPKKHHSVISIDIYEIDEENATDPIALLLDDVEHGLSEEQARLITFKLADVLQDRAYVRSQEAEEKATEREARLRAEQKYMDKLLTDTQKTCLKAYQDMQESEDRGYEL